MSEPSTDERLALYQREFATGDYSNAPRFREELRRRFNLGDFTHAAAFAREVGREEDQVERLFRSYLRSCESVEPGWRAGFGQGGVATRLVKTVVNAKRTGGRSWGWTWKRARRGGMKLMLACFADWDLDVATLAVKAVLATERVTSAWPEWRGATSRVRPADLLTRLRAWALDDAEPDRAIFIIRTPCDLTPEQMKRRGQKGPPEDWLHYWNGTVIRMCDREGRLLR